MRDSSWRVRVGMIGLLVCALAGLSAAQHAVAAPSTAEKAELIDINKASLQGLMAVPGIGEVLAKRIVTFREEHGPFRRVEDLMRVKGIGEKSLERLRPYVKVNKAK